MSLTIMQEKFKAIADKIREKLGITDLIKPNDFVNKIDDVYDAAKEAYGLKHTVTGNPIKTAYINPNERKITIKTNKPNAVVKKYGKNLIPYPYYMTTRNINGLDFIDNGDGTITVNGTATAEANFYLATSYSFKIKENTTVSLRGCPFNNHLFYVNIRITKVDGSKVWYNNCGTDIIISGINGVIDQVYIAVKSGTVCDNLLFKPQLEIDGCTEYETGIYPVEYISDDEGKISNIFLEGKDITLVSEEDVEIECEYCRSQDAEYNDFWDKFQKYGNRNEYHAAFANGWSDKLFKPKYDIIFTNGYNSCYHMFYNSEITDIQKCLDEAHKTLDFSKASNFSGIFVGCKSKTIPHVDAASCTNMGSTFSNIQAETVSISNIKPTLSFNTTFSRSSKLKNLILIDCTIGQNGFDVHWSTKLSAVSLYSIISALSTTTTGLSITLPTTAEANYNANPPEGAPHTWTELIATRPNWTIAYTEV